MPRRHQSPPLKPIRIQMVGGINFADPSEVLLAKSFDGPNQIAPLEWQAGFNLDFSRNLGRMRYGSTAGQSLASILQSGETIICGGFFAENNAGSVQFDEIAIGTKSIYVNVWSGVTKGSWVQVTRNSQSTTSSSSVGATGAAYLHNATVAKASICVVDGHAMLMIDGANSAQIYRTSTQLEDPFNSQYTSSSATTNNVSGNSTGATIAITGNVSGAQVGDRIHIHDATHDEYTYITAITVNTSVTVAPVLVQTYTTTSNTGATPAVVTIENRYVQSFGGAKQLITGSLSTGYYMGMSLQGRFGYSRGDVAFEYSGPTNPWDRFNGGVIACDGPIVAMEAFTPRFANLLGAVGVFHTLNEDAALQFLSGFDASSTMATIVGASPPLNHQSVCQTMNWVMYLTRNRRIEATDLSRVIDVGRRLRGQDSDSVGPLNTMNLTQAITTSFAFYDPQKRQAQFYFPDNAATVNTDAMVVDMQLGEPVAVDNQFTDTGSYAFEKAIRMLYWNLDSEVSGATWFTQMYQVLGSIRGVLATGQLYQTEVAGSGNDLDTFPIQFSIKSPDFNAGMPGIQKKWRRLSIRSISTSTGLVQVDAFLDRAVVPATQLNWTFDQLGPGVTPLGVTTFILGVAVLGGGGLVTGHSWLDCAAETLSFQISLSTNRPTGFILSTIDLMYQQANLQD